MLKNNFRKLTCFVLGHRYTYLEAVHKEGSASFNMKQCERCGHRLIDMKYSNPLSVSPEESIGVFTLEYHDDSKKKQKGNFDVGFNPNIGIFKDFQVNVGNVPKKV